MELQLVKKFLPFGGYNLIFLSYFLNVTHLWFYHPNKLPMYDSNTRKGLSAKAENFLGEFEKFYKEHLPNIKKAEKHFSRKYKYHPRVADKYLWLCGSNQDESRLHYLEYTVRHSPFFQSK